MTKVQGKAEIIDLKADIARDADFLRTAVKAALEAALEAEMTEVLGAGRVSGRKPVSATGPATIIAR